MNDSSHAIRFARALALLGGLAGGCANTNTVDDAAMTPDATDTEDAAVDPCSLCTCPPLSGGDVGPFDYDAHFVDDAYVVVADAGPPPDAGTLCDWASRCCPVAGPYPPPELPV